MKKYTTALICLACTLIFATANATPAGKPTNLMLKKTRLAKPAAFNRTQARPAHHSIASAGTAKAGMSPPVRPDLESQATLVYTSTHLDKGYRGVNVGTGALMVFESGGQCEMPPRTLGGPQEINADRPQTRLQIPAGEPLVFSSLWSAGGAHCLMGSYSFTAEQGATYKVTSVQDRAAGTCRLTWQKMQTDTGQFVADASLRRAPGGCQQAALSF